MLLLLLRNGNTLGIIQFKQADELAVKLEQYGTTTYTSDAPRGEIVDREYVKLVENTSVICATYYAPKKLIMMF